MKERLLSKMGLLSEGNIGNKTLQTNQGGKQTAWLRRGGMCRSRAVRIHLDFMLSSNGPKAWGKRVGVTLIFLDLQVRQPVRVLRCVFRAEGLVFMPFMAAECSAPNRNIEDGDPKIAGK
jgi:hypothetical protein